MKNKKKFNLSGPVSFLIALIVLAVFVPINLIFTYSDKVIDMTPSGKYTLNEKTKELLDETSDKHIDIAFLSEMKYVLEVPRYLPLYHTLTELEARENITLDCYDPNKEKAKADALDPNGIFDVDDGDIFVTCDGFTKKIDFRKIFQQDSKGILEYAGEELIAGAIYACTTGNLPTVYFISGYSDKTLEDNYSIYADEIRTDNYQVEELDLSSVDAVPSNASIVYLAAPQKDLSDSDKEKLVNYIDNGGSISMFLPPCETKGRFKNIEFILEKFEIKMNYNIISESNTGYQLQNNDVEQVAEFFRVSYPSLSTEEYTVDLTTDINQLVTDGLYVAGISNTRSFEELAQNSLMIEKAPVIESLPQSMDNYSYTVISTPVGGDDTTKAEAEQLSYQAAELGFYSYNKQTNAKLFVVGTDDVIDNERVCITTYGTRVLSLFSNTWLFDSDIDMGIGVKSNSYDTMYFENADEASSVLRIFMIIPVLVAFIGVAVWFKRRYA